MVLEGNRVDALRVQIGDDRILPDIAELGDLRALAVGQRAIDPAEEEIGLDAERGQVADAVLRGLGLQLAGGGDIGDEGGVDANRVLAAALRSEEHPSELQY